MQAILSLLPQITLTPLNIATAAIVTLVIVIMVSCALAGLLHKPENPRIKKWG